MNDDFIDVHQLNKQFATKLKNIEMDKELSEKNKEIIVRYLRESELGKTIRKGQKRKIGVGRNLQVASFLMLMCKKWFKRNLDDVTNDDMENFVLNIDKGKILCNKGTAYSSEGNSNIKKFIRKFYKWLLGDGQTYPPLVDWIDTSKKDAEIKAVPGLYKGVWRIVELIPDLKRKALIWVTFDSGFRESELLNCRLSDIEKNNDGIYYITCRYSKTKPRTVSLPYSSELLDRWLNEHPEKNNQNAQLWQISRIGFYKTVKRYGKKTHNQNITVHMLRHTSATFWAPKLDRTTFCKRFGWSYNSKMPDRYIDFAKVTENKVIEIVKTEKYSEIKKAMEDQKIQNINLQEKFNEQQKEINLMKKIMLASVREKKLQV